MININGKEWNKLQSCDIQVLIDNQDFDESFYFELKEDKVSTQKVMEEVSAFANTFGGYIILGITNSKQIEGCTSWNEQRIHTTIHDSITPTPSFDVKRFTLDSRIIYVIKIDEGSEPPYITSSGKIYERLSSGSFVIKDSSKLSHIYNKRERLEGRLENKISIPPIQQDTANIYGYIDIGFSLVSSDVKVALDNFTNANLETIVQTLGFRSPTFSLSRLGESILFIPGGLSTQNGHLPAHTNNFLEVMADGSAKMRILLINNNQNDSTVNMMLPCALLNTYMHVYTNIMGMLFPHKMAYAKKYESLTVCKQFNPVYFYDDAFLESTLNWQEENRILEEKLRAYQETCGRITIVTNDRIPKNGLYTIDKRMIELLGLDYTAENIIAELFFSRFSLIGTIPTSD